MVITGKVIAVAKRKSATVVKIKASTGSYLWLVSVKEVPLSKGDFVELHTNGKWINAVGIVKKNRKEENKKEV